MLPRPLSRSLFAIEVFSKTSRSGGFFTTKFQDTPSYESLKAGQEFEHKKSRLTGQLFEIMSDNRSLAERRTHLLDTLLDQF